MVTEPTDMAGDDAGAAPAEEAAAGSEGATAGAGAPLHFEDRPAWEGDEPSDAFSDKPQLFVGGAFAGGFVLAQVLKRLSRG